MRTTLSILRPVRGEATLSRTRVATVHGHTAESAHIEEPRGRRGYEEVFSGDSAFIPKSSGHDQPPPRLPSFNGVAINGDVHGPDAARSLPVTEIPAAHASAASLFAPGAQEEWRRMSRATLMAVLRMALATASAFVAMDIAT